MEPTEQRFSLLLSLSLVPIVSRTKQVTRRGDCGALQYARLGHRAHRAIRRGCSLGQLLLYGLPGLPPDPDPGPPGAFSSASRVCCGTPKRAPRARDDPRSGRDGAGSAGHVIPRRFNRCSREPRVPLESRACCGTPVFSGPFSSTTSLTPPRFRRTRRITATRCSRGPPSRATAARAT